MTDIKDKLLNRLGIADSMAVKAKATAQRLHQAAAKHHDAANSEIADLGRQIEAAGVGKDEDLERRYCRALVARRHMVQAHHLSGQDAARMPEVARLEKGRITKNPAQQSMGFEEEQHPRAAQGTVGQYKPGEFIPKGLQQANAGKVEAVAAAAEENVHPGLAEAHEAEPLTPKEDWKKNTTRSRAFKNWFGDWENDPEHASKVVATCGEPAETYEMRQRAAAKKKRAAPVFHGSGKGGFRSFDLSKTNPNGLVGPGFYFTENPDIAASYLGKEAPEMTLSRDLTDEDMDRLREWGNERRGLNGVSLMLNMAKNNTRHRFQSWLVQQDQLKGVLAVLGVSEEVRGQEKLYSCYLNMRNPWDCDRKLTKVDAEAIWQHWPADHPWKRDHADAVVDEFIEQATGKTSMELFGFFHNPFGFFHPSNFGTTEPGDTDWTKHPKVALMKALQAMGHDGLTHIGGTYAGTGDTKHRVWVAWEPNQIKANDNDIDGTFDPSNPDIYKALASDRDRPFVPPDMPEWRGRRPSADSYLPLNGVEDREKFRAMAKEMAGGTWTWTKPLIKCGDQLLTGSHRYAAAKVAGVPLKVMDVDRIFEEAGLDFKTLWEAVAQSYDGWLSNMDRALKLLPPDLLVHYGIDLG